MADPTVEVPELRRSLWLVRSLTRFHFLQFSNRAHVTFAVNLLLSTISAYVGVGSRCGDEGEQGLRAKHIIECSAKDVRGSEIDVVGFVLQTAALQNDPHEVNITLELSDSNTTVKAAQCSCKAE